MMMYGRLACVAAIAACVFPSCRDDGPSGAGEFPRKPIKVIVPFPAGGGSDTFTRIMQKAIRENELLPQPIVVINVPGAGGSVGSRRVRDAQPDGYTILNLHEGMLSSKYSGRTAYGPEAFRPIAATGRSGLVICVRNDSPFQSLAELMEAAVKTPEGVRFGMAPGTPTHFTGRKLELAAEGARFRMVASGGGSKRFNDLLGRHIDATPFSVAEFIKFAPGGIRALAYLGRERHSAFPDLPTARESGFEVSMTHIQYWWAPKSTPNPAIERLAEALKAALETEFVREKLAELKTEPLFLAGGELEDHLAARESEFRDAALVQYDDVPDPVAPVTVLAVLLAVAAIFKSRGGSPQRSTATAWRYFAMTAGILALYVLAMQVAGLSFATATVLFIPLMGIAAGVRSLRNVALLTAAGALLAWGCVLVFTEVLVVDLP